MTSRARIVMEKADEWRRKPFDYRAGDCCRFAADVIRSLTGVDHMAELDYKTEAQALARIRRHGGLAGAISAVMGESRPPGEARTGDLLLIDVNGREMAAMAFNGLAVCRTANGIIDVPNGFAVACWRV